MTMSTTQCCHFSHIFMLPLYLAMVCGAALFFWSGIGLAVMGLFLLRAAMSCANLCQGEKRKVTIGNYFSIWLDPYEAEATRSLLVSQLQSSDPSRLERATVALRYVEQNAANGLDSTPLLLLLLLLLQQQQQQQLLLVPPLLPLPPLVPLPVPVPVPPRPVLATRLLRLSGQEALTPHIRPLSRLSKMPTKWSC